jgi:hypothetical protein
MQFITNGPQIPEALLRAHEDGHVVFFCGAGISYAAGLPSFRGLVDKIYERLSQTKQDIEKAAFTEERFDTTLNLLARRLLGGRQAVLNELEQVLQPKLRRKGATDTHAALLELARNREGQLHLVTTNFDRLFEHAAKRTKQTFRTDVAPMLPIPKRYGWNGLVHLHGRLDGKENSPALQQLVVTSADFGRAYLTERWAARFVSELFRHYVVCFVGYSINDPVLRYMMDALAADKEPGNVNPQAYALGECEPGEEDRQTKEWRAKGVTPILYQVSNKDHSALHNTLKQWADDYRDGIQGKEAIVSSLGSARPSASTAEEDFLGRMHWAISDKSGLPAKRFAELNPVPSLDWLKAFSEDRYQHNDLSHFGVEPDAAVKGSQPFSLIRRPAPHRNAPRMALVSRGAQGSNWDAVMNHLARWLVRHLNDPNLIVWLAGWGGQLHPSMRWLIDEKLNEFARLAREGKTAELNAIRAHAPNAIPCAPMQTLWRFMLSGRVYSHRNQSHFFQWMLCLKRDGLTTTLRLELREVLMPKVAFTKARSWAGEEGGTSEPTSIDDCVGWELMLADDAVRPLLRDEADETWCAALPALVNEFQQLLRDALDLLQELGAVNDQCDRSHWAFPSIGAHKQNRYAKNWVVLIELLRDAWLVTLVQKPERAARMALDWFNAPYSTFKRLALFAATQDSCIAPDQWVEWLVADNARWLWEPDTKREVMRLLVLKFTSLSPEAQTKLQAAILLGGKHPKDIGHGSVEVAEDVSVWRLLAKIKEGGGALGPAASECLAGLSAAHPAWQLQSHERDEFSIWSSGTGDPDFEMDRKIDLAPRKRKDLVGWLQQPPPPSHPLNSDTWREICRTRFFHSFSALCDLAKEGHWPAERWAVALHAWSEQGQVLRSWRFAAPLVKTMPTEVMQKIAGSVAWWMKAASDQPIDRHEDILMNLCSRILEIQHPKWKISDQPVSDAINHPVGHVTQALLNQWLKRKLVDDGLLPPDIKPIFTQLCDVNVAQFRYARVVLASQLVTLFRVDPGWTTTHLLPLFDWSRSEPEATAAWEGFLRSPRLYEPLMQAFKAQFLSTAGHYGKLNEYGQMFAGMLTHAALEGVEGFTPEEFQLAVAALPPEGLQQVAQGLWHALASAGEQRESYWKNRVQPFWKKVWPYSKDRFAKDLVDPLALLCIKAGGEFPVALKAIRPWLQPIEDSSYVISQLETSKLCEQFPRDALALLRAVISDPPIWLPPEFKTCIDAIAQAEPGLAQRDDYKKLATFARQHGL